MPNLGTHRPSSPMNFGDYFFPSLERFLPIKMGNIPAVGRGRPVDHSAFRKNKAYMPFGAAPIIGGDFRRWNPKRREASCHRCHDKTIF